MARKVEVTLVDDLDGSSASGSVSFSIEGTHYEIDLSDKNAQELRDGLAKYIEAGRRVASPKSKAPVRAGKNDTAEIREWAQKNGYNVSSRGRIHGSIIEAYRAAH
ncbi:histone-like nucleoid-structuring protein Lsr2 [Zhihengliuella salsuginis]|uniref:Lsr2 family protein n=1 Tax=Zhihengliuella salsuginis TaxID=578222 RepID=A0ABQ3GMR5_9MICC|nr:Lsr2 family protein [Zhihengliuella salsuginis]GHD13599.1 Lsr2 family protein [Zhihengliuella salsuginis]